MRGRRRIPGRSVLGRAVLSLVIVVQCIHSGRYRQRQNGLPCFSAVIRVLRRSLPSLSLPLMSVFAWEEKERRASVFCR